MSRTSRYLLLWIALASAVCCQAAGPTGSFIQLNRRCADRTETDWRADMKQMSAIGIRSIIVQWCAEPGIAYIESELPYPMDGGLSNWAGTFGFWMGGKEVTTAGGIGP